MELNILLEGDGTGPAATRRPNNVASSIAHNLSALTDGVRTVHTKLAETSAAVCGKLKQLTAPFDVVIFDDLETPDQLFMCVSAIKEFRLSRPTSYAAVFVCAPGVIVLSNAVPIVLNGEVSPEQEQKLREAFEQSNDQPRHILTAEPGIKMDMAAYAKLEEQYGHAGPGEEDSRQPLGPALVWDSGVDCYQAATLVLDGRVVCEARDIMKYKGGVGRKVLFEKDTQLPSGFIAAKDNLNDHYFRTGTFGLKSFNDRFVAPATISEVQDYLNAKYEYEKSKDSN